MSNQPKPITYLLSIHMAVMLFSMSGLLGKLITNSPEAIVTVSGLIAGLTTLLVIIRKGLKLRIDCFRDWAGILVMGALLASHWICFFYAVKTATVAIAVFSISTYPIFVTFIEPIVERHRLKTRDLFTALLVFSGVMLVVPEFHLNNGHTQGVLWGLASALSVALLPILSRHFVRHYAAIVITLYQSLAAALLTLPFAGVAVFSFSRQDMLYLLVLGIACTALANTLFIYGMKRVKAQLASLINCLEPLYGVGLAYIFLNEVPASREILGGGIIIVSLFIATSFREVER